MITPVRVRVFRARGEVNILGYFLLVQNRRISQTEGTGFHGHGHVIGFIRKSRTTRTQIERTGGTKVLGGLEDLRALTVVQRNLLDVLHGEFTQIDCTILGVTDLDTVIENTQVMGSHRTQIDGLQTTYSTIILDLHPGEITHGIRHALRVQSFQTCPF